MGWKMFLVEMSKSWAWPIALGVFCWVFYTHITRIVATALRTVRRMQRLKIGDIEFATGVVKAAVASSQVAAEAVEERMSDPDLKPEERQRLVEELKEVIAEREKLKSILESVEIQERPVKPIKMRVPTLVVGRMAMRELADVVGALNVVEKFTTDKDGLISIVNEVIERYRTFPPNTPKSHLNSRGIRIMQSYGWVNDDCTLNEEGLVRLFGVAKMILNESSQ